MKALARSAAAQLRELHDGLRLLPTVAREIPRVLPRERRAKLMAVTVAVLLVVRLILAALLP